MRPLLLTVALAGAALFLLGHHFELTWLRLLSKPLPIICLLLWLREAPAGHYRRWIAIGLGLSLLGDLLLEWPADLGQVAGAVERPHRVDEGTAADPQQPPALALAE